MNFRLHVLLMKIRTHSYGVGGGGGGGGVTDAKGDCLDTVCCLAVAIEVFWDNQSALTIS